MIYSMTGYASHECNTAHGVLQVELRSVNHRYLELQLKLDESCRPFESTLREQLGSKIGRGKVDCRISLQPAAAASNHLQLDHLYLRQLAQAANEAAQYFSHAQPVNMLDVLRMPGAVKSETVDAQAIGEAIKIALESALVDFNASRSREGEKLKQMILTRLAEIEQLVAKVKPILPGLLKNYQQKLLTKLQEAMQSADDERIRQEIVLYAQRVDVDEEVSRLSVHTEEVKRILAGGGLVGKRLDFLMQEMNREANTLGSKSMAIETSQIAMEIKVLIEQMREQIQNME